MDLLRAVRLTVRDLLRQPAYTASTVLTLALAIGANSAIFSAVHGVLLTPSAIRQPDNLVICWERDVPRSPVVELSYRNFQDWVAHSRSFSQAAAIGSSTWPAILDGRGESVRLASAGVSASFFDTLGVAPALGRSFRTEDDAPNAERVVILSHATWVTRFGEDPDVIGTTIQLDESVTPLLVSCRRDSIFRTAQMCGCRSCRSGQCRRRPCLFPARERRCALVIGRLPNVLRRRWQQRNEPPRRATSANGRRAPVRHRRDRDAIPRLPDWSRTSRPLGTIRSGWCASLIGCANVSGLMLTRVSVRRREHAIRLALGATSRHLRRHWALETLILSLAGGSLGLIASRWMVQGVVALAPEDVPRLTNISINLPVAAFTFLAGPGDRVPLWSAAGPARRHAEPARGAQRCLARDTWSTLPSGALTAPGFSDWPHRRASRSCWSRSEELRQPQKYRPWFRADQRADDECWHSRRQAFSQRMDARTARARLSTAGCRSRRRRISASAGAWTDWRGELSHSGRAARHPAECAPQSHVELPSRDARLLHGNADPAQTRSSLQ